MRSARSLGYLAVTGALGAAAVALLLLSPPLLQTVTVFPTARIEPVGARWTLTPPSTWCIVTPLPGGNITAPPGNKSSGPTGGEEVSCSMAGAAIVQLNVTRSSRISGTLSVNGSFTVWLEPSVWSCEFLGELSGFPLPCPIPYDPPGWASWNGSYAATSSLNLSTLPFHETGTIGVIPPATWSLYVVDDQRGNETATVTSAILLSGA